ncbi:MAG TPA: DUF5989 family protein [bacterium]|nr:DUF5989 family protein [bacterium]
MDLIKEFIVFLWQRKLWWMAPIIIVLGGLSLLIVFTQGSSLAPFIYAVF